MQIALDTNIFVNIFNGQAKSDSCYDAIAKALKSGNHCMVSASAITDIYYIVSKKLGHQEAKIAISALLAMSRVFDVNERDIRSALESEIKDYEDAVFERAAARNGAELILTYNKKDFAKAIIPAMTPEEYLKG